MKTWAFGSRSGGRAGLARLVAGITALLALAAAGCDQGHDGDRCVLALSHNDCASSDLTCMQPTDCPETYCCSDNSSNPYCQAGCNGGALSILFASCSTATPSPLCPCINVINGINLGPLPSDQYPTGVDCSCVSVGDPIACLTASADGGTPDAGGATPDAATPDAATPDAATPDAATPDATVADSGSLVPDAGGDASGE